MEDAAVSSMLSALPSPPIPAEVAAAIEARLAEERTVVPMTRRHTRRLNWLVAAAAAVAFLALIGVSGSGQTSPPVAQPPVVRAGAVFEPTAFAEQLKLRMTDGPTSTATATFADSPEQRRACATAVQAYGRLMFLDVGTYDRAAAVVMVTSYPANTDYEEVWVVAPDCGAGSTAVYRHMIYDLDGSLTTRS